MTLEQPALLDKSLFKSSEVSEMVKKRLDVFEEFYSEATLYKQDLYLNSISKKYLFDYVLPLGQFIVNLSAENLRLVIGIAGGSGAGKTTLSTLIKLAIPYFADKKVLKISMDDFFLSKLEREKRGLKWRTDPGGHDSESLLRVIKDFQSGKPEITHPIFDKGIDDRAGERVERGPFDITILETVYEKNHCAGDWLVNKQINFLIFLDQPIVILKRQRFLREARIRRTGKGFSRQKMLQFWDEAIEESIKKYLLPVKNYADLIIELNDKQMPKKVILKNN